MFVNFSFSLCALTSAASAISGFTSHKSLIQCFFFCTVVSQWTPPKRTSIEIWTRTVFMCRLNINFKVYCCDMTQIYDCLRHWAAIVMQNKKLLKGEKAAKFNWFHSIKWFYYSTSSAISERKSWLSIIKWNWFYFISFVYLSIEWIHSSWVDSQQAYSWYLTKYLLFLDFATSWGTLRTLK